MGVGRSFTMAPVYCSPNLRAFHLILNARHVAQLDRETGKSSFEAARFGLKDGKTCIIAIFGYFAIMWPVEKPESQKEDHISSGDTAVTRQPSRQSAYWSPRNVQSSGGILLLWTRKKRAWACPGGCSFSRSSRDFPRQLQKNNSWAES